MTKHSYSSAKRSLSESSAEELNQNNRHSVRPTRRPLSNSSQHSSCTRETSSHFAAQQSKYQKPASTPLRHLRISERSLFINNMWDIGLRVLMAVIFVKLEMAQAFHRKIHLEEMWLYKNPRTEDYVSSVALLSSVVLGPLTVTLLRYSLTRDKCDFIAATLAWLLALGINGTTTSTLKNIIGRPRPDFFYRCFPDGIMVLNNATAADTGHMELFNCTGNPHDIREGRKSFPSGHASFTFASFGFLTFYIGAKLHAFHPRGSSQSWRLCLSIMPLLLALLVGLSRMCDYHHHWEDVLAGSVLGLSISYFVYRQYYPGLREEHCERPLQCFSRQCQLAKPLTLNDYKHESRRSRTQRRTTSGNRVQKQQLCEADLSSNNGDDKSPLLAECKESSKWF